MFGRSHKTFLYKLSTSNDSNVSKKKTRCQASDDYIIIESKKTKNLPS